MPDPEVGRILNQSLGPNAADPSSDARSPPPPPPPPGSPPQRPSEKPRAATRACERCRQMKVKCEGFDNPPCVRCNKSGKECQFIVLEKIRNHDSREGPPRKRARVSGPVSTTYRSLESTPVAQHTTGIPQWTSVQPNSAHTSVSARTSNLGGSARNYVDRVSPSSPSSAATPTVPSIYSTSPLDAVNERDANNSRYSSLQTSEASTGGRHQAQQPIWNLTNTVHSPAPGEELKIPKRDMRGMIKIFCDKLLPYIPVFTIQDFQDADHLIETDLPLVYCLCYVAAQFLSRGKHLREMLMPKVTQILNGKLTSGRSQTNDLSTLKALIILYSYANCSPPSAHDAGTARSEEILYWPLKSLVEVFGLRLGLNRAAYDLQAELRVEKSSPITESTAYQKYTLWLQLFTMAHYASVLTGTPPTIPIDSTIRIAPVLMEPIGACPQARLFGEVELAIIWEKVGTGRELGEWWCLDSSKNVDERETQSVLRQVDQLLDAWYEKWEYFINDEEGHGAVLDYLGRCCRFWLNSYATQHLRTSSTGLNSIQQNQIRTCVKYASHVLDWPLDLSPFEKESLRYIPEAGGTMVAYCCLFIVASYQTFGSILPDFHSDLDKVDAAAQLMVDMAPDSEHSTHQQGLLILKRTASLRKQSRSRNHENDRPDPAGSMESQIAPGLGSQDTVNDMFNFGLPTMDMIWDFSMLVPRTW